MIAKPRTPKFSSEAQERQFWEAHDSANLVDWVEGLERIKAAANARDVPYQSLIKVWLEEKLSA